MDEFIGKYLSDGTVRYTGGGYPLAVFGGEDGIVYIACVEGLYRHALGGSTMEQIIDGALSTFGDDGSIYAAKALEGQEYSLILPAGWCAIILMNRFVPCRKRRYESILWKRTAASDRR